MKKKKKMKSIKEVLKRRKKDLLVPAISVIVLILFSFIFSYIFGIISFIFINLINFIIKQLKKNNKRKKKKTFKIVLLILLACFILGIIGVIAFLGYIVVNAPEFSEDLLYVTEPTVIIDKDGNEIAKLGAEKRIVITYDEMPEVLIDAIIATEDSRFFEHKGVDWARFLKASVYQLLGNSEAGGASTLTMQVSKNSISKDNTASGIKGIIRKFTDVYVSMAKIEKNYTKEQIMEFYVNSYYLGNSAYGVEQASLNYFGKNAKDLNLAEASMIAGLFQAPGKYDPYTNPELTEGRRQTVLKLMLRHGYISKKEYNIAKKMSVESIVVPEEENKLATSEISPYQSFIDTVVKEIQNDLDINPYTSSMTIYTTLDTNIQNYINNIMNGSKYEWENNVVQAGVAIINVNNGSIAAIGGNRKNDRIDAYNYATDINKQIGSTAKPLYDYGPAIEYNNWSSYQILVDEPITYSDGNSINNWNGAFEGIETMRTALNGSRNIPALKAFKANDKSKVLSFVKSLGLNPEEEGGTLHEAHAIGGYNGENPLSMAAAYSAFANGGYYTKPYSYTKLIYNDSGVEYSNEIEKNKVMSDETAYMISDMLTTTAIQAMGWYYNINNIRYSAKTGTTNYDIATLKAHKLEYSNAVNDLWTVGFNTEYAIGVWYGYNEVNEKYYNKLSSGQHERLFQAVGKKVFTNKASFKQPDGVIAVEVELECPEACLPSEYTPNKLRKTELFIKGTEPTTVSTRFSKLDKVTNLSANATGNKITLSWDAVKTPQINDKDYLTNLYTSVFQNNSYLNAYVNSRIGYINAYIGNIGYNVYKKDADGKLTLIEYTSDNSLELNIENNGEYIYAVKTAYSIFKNNMSDEVEVKVNVSSIIPTTDNNNNNNNKESLTT